MEMNTPDLQTKRLILRRFTQADIPALLAIYGDEEVNTFLPWFPIASLEQAQELFAQRYEAAYQQPRGYRYAICLKEDNVPIGYVHVSMEDNHDFGYALRKEFWHQGIVSEASRAVVEQLKQDGFLYITATHDVQNPRSGNVMKQLGMHYCYSYEEQWQPKDRCVTFRMYQLNFDGDDARVYQAYWEQAKVRFVEEQV